MHFFAKDRKRIVTFIVPLLIVVVAFALRLYKLDSIPPGLHRDEVSTGYNAYSIFLTGRDEHSQFLPLAFRAFGDWKRPINIYLTLLFIPIIGLNEWAVRLPIAIVGSLTVLLVYYLVLKVSNSQQVAIVSSLLIAISPWHIFMSRSGLGWNAVGLFLFLAGVYTLIIANKRIPVLLLSAVCFGLTLFSYASNQILTPLFFVILAGYFIQKLIHDVRLFIVPVLIFLLFFLVFIKTYYPIFIDNSAGSSFYSNEFIYSHNDISRMNHSDTIVKIVFHNKYGALLKQFIENYTSVFSPQFLFFNTYDNPSYSLVDSGNFYLIDIIFIVIGLITVRRMNIKYKFGVVIVLLLLPIPAALTKNPYSSTRTLTLVPLVGLCSAYAITYLYRVLNQKNRLFGKILVLIIIFAYSISLASFLDAYFFHFPVNRAKHWGYVQERLAHYVVGNESKYTDIIIDRPEEAFYSYLLFYKQYDPKAFWEQATWYPETSDGFSFVRSFDKYTFKPIEYEKDSTISGRLLVKMINEGDKEASLPARVVPYVNRLGTITLPNGSPIFILYETKRIIQ